MGGGSKSYPKFEQFIACIDMKLPLINQGKSLKTGFFFC